MKKINTFQQIGGGRSPYSRPNLNDADNSRGAGTYIPGIHDNPRNNNNHTNLSEAKSQKNEEPVVGFLYSISRNGIGEYWPLHLGKNVIGRDADCDIRLNEASVSGRNSILSITKQRQANKIIASIQDDQAKISSFLNDEELGYERVACNNEDIITIGANYRLLLLLIDPVRYGLSVSDEFMPTDAEDEDGFSNIGGNLSDDSTDFNLYDSSNRNTDTGTVDLNGVSGNERPGGTKFM